MKPSFSIKTMLLMASFLLLSLVYTACEDIPRRDAVSDSGVAKAVATVQTNPNGRTVEQEQVLERYRRDNLPGSIKHLYVISTTSGQVLIYSTVKGKVTSASKRLTPGTVVGYAGDVNSSTNYIMIGDRRFITNELIGDDGTYGSSGDYIYWFDSKDVYHQEYMSAGTLLHISDQPLAVKSIVLNFELTQ